MKKTFIIIILVSIVMISGCASSDTYQKNYANQTLNFRAELNRADKVSVYPNEDALKSVLFNESVKRVRVAYIPNDTENAFYYADTYEIGYKLTIIYRHKFGKVVEMQSFPVNNTEEAKSYSSPMGPIILMLGPSSSDETSVTVDENLIILRGQSFDETDRAYTDLDLSTAKMLLVLMGE